MIQSKPKFRISLGSMPSESQEEPKNLLSAPQLKFFWKNVHHQIFLKITFELKDIYQDKEGCILDSVLKSFDYNVSKTVQWFVNECPGKRRFPIGTSGNWHQIM